MINSSFTTAEITRKGKIVTKHSIKENEEQMKISITIVIDKSRNDFEKIKTKMLEKQQTPAIDILRKIERNNNNENGAIRRYTDPEIDIE